jgi:hypothetical protein
MGPTAKFLEFLLNPAPGLLLFRFSNLWPVVFRTAIHLRQQFFAKFLAPDKPPPLQRRKFLRILSRTTQLHAPLKVPAPRRAVLGDTMFPQQTVHPQPGLARGASFQVLRVAAPTKR